MTHDTAHGDLRPRLVLAVPAVLLAVLTGCGSGTPGTPAAAPPTTAAPTSTPGPTGAAPAGATVAGSQAPVPVESNPPGDIPDSLAFVAYRNAAGGFSLAAPEGWARSETGARVDLTDKLNGIRAETATLPSPLTVDTVRQQVVAQLQQTEPAFELRTLAPVTLPAGPGVRVVYRRNSAPDPVTGRQVRDEVESYLVVSGTRQVRLDLYGPVGADNVDAYRTISQSLRLS